MSLKALFSRVNQFQTKSGALNVAGKLRVYFDETDDLAPVYDEDGVVLAQPVILDNNGRAKGLMVQDDKTYRLEVYNASDALMFTVRHMVPGEGGGSGGGFETITSEDGSITVTHTEMGWDLSVTKPEPSVIQATSEELTAQGPFTIYEVRKVQGDDLWLDTTLKQIRCKRGWYHADFNVVFQNTTARNQMLTIGFADSLGQWHGEYHYDLSYTDQLCEACGFDFFVETDGTVFQIIETDTLPSGIKMFLTALDIHTLVAVVDGDEGGGIQEITSTDGSITVTASGTGVDLAVTNPARDYTTRGSWDRSLQIDNSAHTISGDMQCVAIRQQINNSSSEYKYAKVCEADINTITWINEWATTLQLSFQCSGAYYEGKSTGIFNLNMENYVQSSQSYIQRHEEDGKWLLWDGDTHSPGLVKLYLYWRDDSSSQHYELWAETSNLKYYETIVAQAVINCSMRNHLTSSLAIDQERNIWRFNSNGIETLKNSLPSNLTLVGQWTPSSASIQPVEDEGPGVFYVEYGTTTFADAEAAYLAGKTLICREIRQTVQETRFDNLYFLIDYLPTAGTYTGNFVFSNINGYSQDKVLLTPSAHYEKISTTLATRYQVMETASAEIAPEYYDICQEYEADDKFPLPAGTVVTYLDNTSSDVLQYVYKSKVDIERWEWSSSGPLQDPSKWDKVHISDILGASVFYADVCVTPFADIKAAYDRGDVIIGKSGSDIYPLYRAYLGTSYSDSFTFACLHGTTWYQWTCYQNSTGYEATHGWATPPGMVFFPERVNIADEYSNQNTYAVGDLCYNGNLYRCTTAIDSPESWTAAHWTQTSLNAELARFATVARTGDYNDLINKPTIPASNVFIATYGTTTFAEIQDAVNAGKLAFLVGHPNNSDMVLSLSTLTYPRPSMAIFSGITGNYEYGAKIDSGTWSYSSITLANSADLATVATSGDYNDLNNLPTIPAAQVNSDWNASSGVAEILNKPDLSIYAQSADLATVATSGDYNDLNNLPTIPAAQVNSDWNASSGVAEILNKPANLVQDSNYVHTDNNFTTSLKDKLDGIATGAEVNVQADWTESDSSSDAYIQNKPTLATVATTGDYDDLTNKPSIPAAQVNSDWNASSGVAEILNKPTLATVATSGDYDDLTNKPTIPAAQVNSDWNASSGVAEILNKPTLATVATTGDYSDLSGTPNLATVATTGDYVDLTNKPSIPAAQVNSDWNASSGVAEILNKPTLATVATTGDYDDLTNKPTIPAAQVNSDWNASTGVAQILNKPTLATVATTGAYSDLSGTPNLATVATSGDYDDLTNKPSIPAAQVNSDWNASTGVAQILNKPTLATVATTGNYSDLNGAPSLATVATTGDYDDLTNKPTIPAAQVNSDWNASSGVAQILNKPTLATVATTGNYSDLNGAPSLATVATTGDYDDLSNKPTIPAAQVNADWNASSGVAEILNKPTIPVVPPMKNLVAGSNITITDSANSVTIAATVPVIGTITV